MSNEKKAPQKLELYIDFRYENAQEAVTQLIREGWTVAPVQDNYPDPMILTRTFESRKEASHD